MTKNPSLGSCHQTVVDALEARQLIATQEVLHSAVGWKSWAHFSWIAKVCCWWITFHIRQPWLDPTTVNCWKKLLRVRVRVRVVKKQFCLTSEAKTQCELSQLGGLEITLLCYHRMKPVNSHKWPSHPIFTPNYPEGGIKLDKYKKSIGHPPGGCLQKNFPTTKQSYYYYYCNYHYNDYG